MYFLIYLPKSYSQRVQVNLCHVILVNCQLSKFFVSPHLQILALSMKDGTSRGMATGGPVEENTLDKTSMNPPGWAHTSYKWNYNPYISRVMTPGKPVYKAI